MEDNEKVVINKIVNDASDSIEIGTPGKSGCVKVYGNFEDAEAFKKKVDAAAEVRRYAEAQLKVNV